MPVQHDQQDDLIDQRARLATIFPRGRFARDVDGTAILTSRADPSAHVFEVAPGRLVGLLYAGGPSRYLHALQGLVVRHLDGDGEGILHLRWSPELAARLPAFSRGRPRGAAFTPATDAFSCPRSDARDAARG
jgi:hypothetical protein